ncbi:hypothetical protein LINGRAHAP2_LOCUS5250, partial [Linum grandiflorum]
KITNTHPSQQTPKKTENNPNKSLFIRVNRATEGGARRKFVRVCVEVDLTKPLLLKYLLEGQNILWVMNDFTISVPSVVCFS